MPSFSPEQDAALKAVADWLKEKPGRGRVPLIFRLFGYAGTGKTTLTRLAIEELGLPVGAAASNGLGGGAMPPAGSPGATR